MKIAEKSSILEKIEQGSLSFVAVVIVILTVIGFIKTYYGKDESSFYFFLAFSVLMGVPFIAIDYLFKIKRVKSISWKNIDFFFSLLFIIYFSMSLYQVLRIKEHNLAWSFFLTITILTGIYLVYNIKLFFDVPMSIFRNKFVL